ncbi:MAG: aminopeptidase P family protein [Coriobacteriia bacterium]|nr:aminopeptidase P family protein [Coriobacteriia bacterium]
MNAGARLAAFRRRLISEGVGAALVTSVANMRYLTGFDGVFDEGINAAVLVTPEFARFYTDSRYIEAAEAAAEGTPWAMNLQAESLYVELCAALKNEGVDSLAIESSVPYGRFKFISEQFHGRVLVVDQWTEELRSVKEAAEVEACARAAALTDAALEHVLGVIRPGMREVDVALALEVYMRSNGSEGVAFAPIVASGPNSSRPHAGVTDRVIGVGELLKMDFGARIDGYCADLTRTIVVGTASDEQRRMYEAVLAANEAALAAVRPGVPTKDVDGVARRVLTDHGYGDRFTHGLGHGVGLAVHELPTVGPRSNDVLRAGSIVTIEPGVYVPGFGGVRIEDLVAVEEGGHRLLSHAPKHLIELE